MFDVEIQKRAQYSRVILSERNRIADHLVRVGTHMVDMGAITAIWCAWKKSARATRSSNRHWTTCPKVGSNRGSPRQPSAEGRRMFQYRRPDKPAS